MTDPAAAAQLTPAQLRTLADQIEARDCTGIAAQWCPVHGTCTCPREDDGQVVRDNFDSPDCPLHAAASSHATPAPEHP